MQKSQIILSLLTLALGSYAVDSYRNEQPCHEIVKGADARIGTILLDKCKGKTWALVKTKETPSEIFGYVPEEDEKKIETLVWTRVHKGKGILTFED